MFLKDANHKELIKNVCCLIPTKWRLSPALKATIELPIARCIFLMERLTKKLKVTNILPFQDPNHQKKSKVKSQHYQITQLGH